ncbi:hypothetical protein, partial [Salmonella enterica]|uniref:hypothetical protein n=1 Tax=Salmonella enterica TaxID=28901 RepID=UPI001ED9B535
HVNHPFAPYRAGTPLIACHSGYPNVNCFGRSHPHLEQNMKTRSHQSGFFVPASACTLIRVYRRSAE